MDFREKNLQQIQEKIRQLFAEPELSRFKLSQDAIEIWFNDKRIGFISRLMNGYHSNGKIRIYKIYEGNYPTQSSKLIDLNKLVSSRKRESLYIFLTPEV